MDTDKPMTGADTLAHGVGAFPLFAAVGAKAHPVHSLFPLECGAGGVHRHGKAVG